MRKLLVTSLLWMLAWNSPMQASPKPHVVTLGKPVVAKLFPASPGPTPVTITVRPLYVDGRLREFTTGETHDITERQFAVQRAYRINDSLPGDDRTLPKWQWQRGGWLLVDRALGRISPLRLPDFDSFHSEVAWYRDYAAYCGTSENADKLYAVVAQIGQRKPVLRSPLGELTGTETEPPCNAPVWQRTPVHVIFTLKDGRKLTFTVRGRAVDLAAPEPAASEDESD